METPNTRVCPVCGYAKFFDPTQPRQSKARGFSGKTCWDCFKESRRGVERVGTPRAVLEAQRQQAQVHEAIKRLEQEVARFNAQVAGLKGEPNAHEVK